MLKLKIGDTIKVLSGKDKGRTGKIEKIFPKKEKVLVPGLNIYKRHVKSAPGREGGIFEIPRPYSVGKVAVVCPSCKKPTRVGFKNIKGEKARICRKCDRQIDKAIKA